jgi:hypothetical protein
MANVESLGKGDPVRAECHKRLKNHEWILVLLVGACMVLMQPGEHRLGSMSPEATATESRDKRQADWFVPSRPETVTWGWILIDKPPVLTIQSGQTVRIDTISHQGAMHDEDPVTVFGALGIKPEEIL